MNDAPGNAFYADTSENALELKARLEEAGFVVTSVTATDLAKEGLSFTSRELFRVDVAPDRFEEASEYVSRSAPELLAAIEGMSTGVLGIMGSPTPPLLSPMTAGAQASADQCALWEKDTAAWTDALFSRDEDACEAALSWIERTDHATALDIVKAVERACREDRYDLTRPLTALLRPCVPDLFKGSEPPSPQKAVLIAKLLRQDAPAMEEALESLEKLACDAAPVARKNFCQAAAELWSLRYLPTLVELLEDPEEEVRYEASGALYAMVHTDFGYDSEAPAEQRAAAVAKWREWLGDLAGGGSFGT